MTLEKSSPSFYQIYLSRKEFFRENSKNLNSSPSESQFEISVPSKPNEIDRIFDLIEQSYKNYPIHYASIKTTKLDVDFILSVNDFLDRLKGKIYKDFLRHRNGRSSIRHFVRLIRCIWKISFEQSNEINRNEFVIKRTILYVMTAVEHLLQMNFPSNKKSISNFLFNEFISMWFHENLRLFQEDLCILIEHQCQSAFFPLSRRLCREFEAICTLNWVKTTDIFEVFRRFSIQKKGTTRNDRKFPIEKFNEQKL